jgi:peptidoglycan/xylan/chitin deacetylase (PgdA/CDA1 family)
MTRTMMLGLISSGILVAVCLSILFHPIPLVFMLHSVPQTPEDPLDVSSGRFMAFAAKVSAGRAPAVFTTDSSDLSVYRVYAPVMLQLRQAALVFLLPPLIGRPGMLTWDQVRELAARGMIFGSHTLSHPWLPDLSAEELRCELCDSKRRIEEQLGHPITAMAYPYGAFDDRVRAVIVECGYTHGYSTTPGRRVSDDDRLAIKRVPITESVLGNPLLEWLAASRYYVTVRERLLSFVPIDIPRKPKDWSYPLWQRTVKPAAHRECLTERNRERASGGFD